MSRCVHSTREIVVLVALQIAASASALPADAKPASSLLRWTEGQPGCTFSRDDDGKYRYGLWTDEFGVVLAVDSQELEKSRRRIEPIFAVLLRIRYRGSESLEVTPEKSSLEFVKHYHDRQSVVDPVVLSSRLNAALANFKANTDREIRNHPEHKDAKQVQLKAQQENVAEMIDFLHKNVLRDTRLDAQNPEALGWVFFDVDSKWIGNWKKQEEFILRVPLANRVLEFPFLLPPSEGDLILRRR